MEVTRPAVNSSHTFASLPFPGSRLRIRSRMSAEKASCVPKPLSITASSRALSSATKQSAFSTVRRLVRQPIVSVRLQFPGEEGRADETLEMLPGQPLRQTILSRGIKLNDPLALRFDSGGPGDCGGEGCCCTCAVQVVAGLDALNEQKSQERQMLKKHADWRLGCRAAISPSLDADSELVIRASPRNWNSKELLADVDECEVAQ